MRQEGLEEAQDELDQTQVVGLRAGVLAREKSFQRKARHIQISAASRGREGFPNSAGGEEAKILLE